MQCGTVKFEHAARFSDVGFNLSAGFTLTSSGQLFFFAAAPNCEIGLAKSGVKGPLMWGSSSSKLI